ncbi:sperm-associated microtubule inner protein 10-like [Chaetodon auriga]|uniref:sperm-associated microtubule inner protein 10-like n=1 Tax=Chaetodon auriga TaxID=39042 RepID=UPI004032C905
MTAAAESPHQNERSSHIPTFSERHPMIPKLYVMPWKQDMKNQRLLMKNAALAGIPVVPLEESLCFCGRERLCPTQDSTSSSSSSSCSSAPLSQTGLPAHHSSHFSRYNSSVVTTRRLYQT